MKKFELVKVTFEAYIAVAKVPLLDVQEQLQHKLSDKIEMYCADNAFGLSDCKVTLSEIQE